MPTIVIHAKAGIQSRDDIEGLYRAYLQALKKGAYNYIKEEIIFVTQKIFPRKYFSGGVVLDSAMLFTKYIHSMRLGISNTAKIVGHQSKTYSWNEFLSKW